MDEKSKQEIIFCNNLEDLPSLSALESLQRGTKYIIVFGEEIENQREFIGREWQKKLPNFSICINIIEPKITVSKLITDKEIEDNQELFEKYARDYKELSTKLIYQLADKFNINIEKPTVENYMALKASAYKSGEIGNWKYNFHGGHCCFTNTKTEQCVEVPCGFGLQFRRIESCFLLLYINTTSNYKPLKVPMYNGDNDFRKVVNKMVELGRFERIELENGNKGVVVKEK